MPGVGRGRGIARSVPARLVDGEPDEVVQQRPTELDAHPPVSIGEPARPELTARQPAEQRSTVPQRVHGSRRVVDAGRQRLDRDVGELPQAERDVLLCREGARRPIAAWRAQGAPTHSEGPRRAPGHPSGR